MLHGIGLKTPANIWAHNPAVPLGVPIPLKRIGDGGLYQQSGGNRNVRNRNFSRGNKDSNVPETQTTINFLQTNDRAYFRICQGKNALFRKIF
jgi:hypothetical protein